MAFWTHVDGSILAQVRGRASQSVRCEPGVFVLPRYSGGALSSRGRHGSLWNQESDWAVERNAEFSEGRDWAPTEDGRSKL